MQPHSWQDTERPSSKSRHPRPLPTCLPIGLRLALSLRLARAIRRNILLNLPLKSFPQLRPVSKRKQSLQPHKERRQEDGLHQIVEQRRSASFIDAVSNELCKPAEDVDADRPFIRGTAVRAD